MATKGMVAAAHKLAAQAGVEVLMMGGNAVDAAVATALALNVVEPNASGIGGGGFMTVYLAATGEVIVLDYREVAPASATTDMFASDKARAEKWSQLGGKSVGVPGWLVGMWTALEEYGTMTFAEVAAPAVRLAEEGFPLHPDQSAIIADSYAKLLAYNDPETLPFLEWGLPLEPGAVLKQPALAHVFRLVAAQGPDVFYNGPIGEAMVATVNNAGGAMTMDDLQGYRVKVRKPVYGTYRGYQIYSVPPASSGGTHIIQLLNILENFPMRELGHNSIVALHIMAEAMKLVFADREKYMADTAFASVPLDGLLSKTYAKELTCSINLTAATVEVQPGNPWAHQKEADLGASDIFGGIGNEAVSTTAFSVIDATGNIVACSNTINFFFGSGVFVPEYGIMLNNQMDDFSKDPASVNAPEPGKRPLSSMAPTIILDPKGQPFMTVGSPGATRIITALAQIIMNVVDHGMKMDKAIEQLRIHNLVSAGKAGKLFYEKGIDPAVIEAIVRMGHALDPRAKGLYFGGAEGILFDPDQGIMYGGADSRRLGVAVGY